MKTMTTVESVERTDTGAYKITLPGNVIAGTLNAEIGDLAVRLAGEDNANPVEIQVEEIGGGRLEVVKMTEVTPPEELGGEPAPANDADDTKRVDEDPPNALDTEPTLDDVITKGLNAYSNAALLAEVERRMTPMNMVQSS